MNWEQEVKKTNMWRTWDGTCHAEITRIDGDNGESDFYYVIFDGLTLLGKTTIENKFPNLEAAKLAAERMFATLHHIRKLETMVEILDNNERDAK